MKPKELTTRKKLEKLHDTLVDRLLTELTDFDTPARASKLEVARCLLADSDIKAASSASILKGLTEIKDIPFAPSVDEILDDI
jgi:hypothetical protein